MLFALLFPSAALAWRPAPGIPLERQLPENRQTFSGSGSGACDFDPNIRECNGTEIWCDIGYYSDGCWMGNYCLPQVLEDGCPGICHENCNWETQDWCDIGDGQQQLLAGQLVPGFELWWMPCRFQLL